MTALGRAGIALAILLAALTSVLTERLERGRADQSEVRGAGRQHRIWSRWSRADSTDRPDRFARARAERRQSAKVADIVDPHVKKLIGWLTFTEDAPAELPVLDIYIDTYNVPQCAMQVRRSADLGAIRASSPRNLAVVTTTSEPRAARVARSAPRARIASMSTTDARRRLDAVHPDPRAGVGGERPQPDLRRHPLSVRQRGRPDLGPRGRPLRGRQAARKGRARRVPIRPAPIPQLNRRATSADRTSPTPATRARTKTTTAARARPAAAARTACNPWP